jgi:hypothetical protein
MTPTALRALAARVLAEEPSDELRDAVLDAIGHHVPPGAFYDLWRPNPLTSHDAAFDAMPAGWRIITITQTDHGYIAKIGRGIFFAHNSYTPVPDLPPALTAAGLLARAVDAEASNG